MYQVIPFQDIDLHFKLISELIQKHGKENSVFDDNIEERKYRMLAGSEHGRHM